MATLLQALNTETYRLERKYYRRLNQAAQGVRLAILANLADFYDQGLPPSMASGAMAAALEEKAQQAYYELANDFYLQGARLGVEFSADSTVKNGAAGDRAWREFIDDTEAVRVLKARQGYCGNFYSLVLHDDRILEEILTTLKEGDFAPAQIEERKFAKAFEARAPELAAEFKNLTSGKDTAFALRRIARTEMWTARSQGTAVQTLRDAEETGQEKIMRFQAIESEVLCDYCRPRDNLFFPAEDAPNFWEMVPPIHYNCRCSIVIATRTVLRRYKITDKELTRDAEKINALPPFDWGGHGLGRDSRAPVP